MRYFTFSYLCIGGAIIILTAACSAGADRTPSSTNMPKVSQNQTTLPRNITVAEAATLRAKGAFILDVREVSEWDQLHVPGSTLIPLGQLSGRVEEVPRNRDIVVICRSGNRSQKGRDVLLDAGFTSVTSVDGGIMQWQGAGYPTLSGGR